VASGTYFTQTTILKLTPALLLLRLTVPAPVGTGGPSTILLVSTSSTFPVLKTGEL